MAFSLRGLCVVLTFWMVCSRPSASIRPGSSVSGSPWEAKELAEIRAAAKRLRATGDLAGLESLYKKGFDLARKCGDIRAEIRFLIDLGNVGLLSSRYSDAVARYLQARDLATSSADWENLGLIALNLSSLYQQVGDSEAALAAAEAGRGAVSKLGSVAYEAELLLILGRLHFSLHDDQANRLYLQGIDAARRQSDAALEARGWDLLSEERLACDDLDGAERAAAEAFRLRILNHGPDLRFSFQYLGAIRLAQARLRNEPKSQKALLSEAMLMTEKALSEALGAKPPLATWLLLHQQGQIEEAQGQLAEAVRTYGSAVDQAAIWWSTLPTADSTLTGANSALHHQVFKSFVEAAADFAKRTQDPRLAAEALMAEEFNRASSLRETQALAAVWRSKLPPAYWETLAQLRAADARVLSSGADPAETNRLRLKISEMESLAGIGFSLSKNENFRSLDSLTHFQRGLKQSELFLSFHLGPQRSYVWAVTNNSFRMYRIEAESGIARRADNFRRKVQDKDFSGEIQRLGSELYAALFGQLSPDEISHPAWLIAAEGPLLSVPFGALVTRVKPKSTEIDNTQGESEYLVERNSVQIVPSALLLRRASAGPGASGRLLAVGDPVYNTADSRYSNPGLFGFWRSTVTDAANHLNRLVGSGPEVEASSQAWSQTSTGAGATILTGTTATRTRFLEELHQPPAAIHIATHVLTPARNPGQAFIAFSLEPRHGRSKIRRANCCPPSIAI